MVAPSLSLEGKVALVTGSRRGIGRAIALRFAEAGADVAVCDYMADEELNSSAEEIKRTGQRSLAMHIDTRDKESVYDVVQKVESELGGIGLLANVAGVAGMVTPLLNLPEEEWDKVLNTNLKGYYLCCQAVGKKMIKRRTGSIINIASVESYNPLPTVLAYGCSKAGVVALTNGLALELGQYNIRVNAIAPGWVKTKMIEEVSDSVLETMASEHALGRIAEPSEIANVALFLASNLASFVTGATWRVDGGFNPPSLSVTVPKNWDKEISQ